MPKKKATVRARGLGAELRELRHKTGLSTRAVAEKLGWSASTISRVETGLRNISSQDVSALLVIYGVMGQERDRLLDLAKESHQRGWWETGAHGLPSQLTALIGFESVSTRITDVANVLVPGLLQIPEYTRALMHAGGISAADTETLVATRMGRQAVLSRPHPPELLAIIDEAALRRPIAGRRVMAEQIRHVIKTSERPNVTVQVLPFEHGAHIGLDGSYVVLEFAKARTVVHLEHKRSGLFLDEPEDVEAYLAATDILRKVALDSAESEKFLMTLADDYER